VKRLDLSFQAFFRRVKLGENPGFPRFQGLHRYKSFCYPQSGFSLEGKTLKVSKVGNLKVVLHRPVEGTIKTCTISKNAVGEWYVSFSCEVTPQPLPRKDTVVGIDLGITTFAALSDKKDILNPKTLKKSEKALAKAQRQKEKLPKGSPERKNKARVVAKIYNKVQNKRNDFCHQGSRAIVDYYQFIVVEDEEIVILIYDADESASHFFLYNLQRFLPSQNLSLSMLLL
jgi:putative transposase